MEMIVFDGKSVLCKYLMRQRPSRVYTQCAFVVCISQACNDMATKRNDKMCNCVFDVSMPIGGFVCVCTLRRTPYVNVNKY